MEEKIIAGTMQDVVDLVNAQTGDFIITVDLDGSYSKALEESEN